MQTKINIDLLKQRMCVEGLTQNELAIASGRDKSTISRLIKTQITTTKTLKNLSEALHCDVLDLACAKAL